MSRIMSKFAVTLVAAVATLSAPGAFANDTTETVQERETGSAASLVAPSSSATATEFVLTENRRETNLRKSPTGITVFGTEGRAQRRQRR